MSRLVNNDQRLDLNLGFFKHFLRGWIRTLAFSNTSQEVESESQFLQRKHSPSIKQRYVRKIRIHLKLA